ncbi:MAG TPA: OsmC family protein, partial [Thermoanaerobaculia bacterium]|nr:OsmC family protein [Thermoanaerobaculia bacterium]
ITICRFSYGMRMYNVTFPGGVAVDVAVNGQAIHTDQDGSAPTPFQLFLASIASCAGFYALRFCQERQIPTEGLAVTMTHEANKMAISVTTPPEFPEKYREALLRAVDHCKVKQAIADRPVFDVKVA